MQLFAAVRLLGYVALYSSVYQLRILYFLNLSKFSIQ